MWSTPTSKNIITMKIKQQLRLARLHILYTVRFTLKKKKIYAVTKLSAHESCAWSSLSYLPSSVAKCACVFFNKVCSWEILEFLTLTGLLPRIRTFPCFSELPYGKAIKINANRSNILLKIRAILLLKNCEIVFQLSLDEGIKVGERI